MADPHQHFQPSPELARLASAYGRQLKTISTFVRREAGPAGLTYFLKSQAQTIGELEAGRGD